MSNMPEVKHLFTLAGWLVLLPPAVDVVYHLWPSCVPVWVEVGEGRCQSLEGT